MTYQFFQSQLSETDPLVAMALANEKSRQQDQIELIASENMVSRAVLDALGHEMTNKTLEGYPGNRFHGGAEFVDVVEQAAIDRAKQLFGCEYANVQPHSGTQANQAVFFGLLQPGDRIMSLDLAAGGHLSHGAGPNLSGRWFDVQHYGVDPVTGRIDYDEMARIANEFKPKLLIAGGSAYPREINFQRMRQVADRVGALFLVDMAHFAGLVAAGVHPSPIPIADIVTCTTTKTMRGPRGGLILSKDADRAKSLRSAIFPGVQGSMHTQIIAAKAVCLGEALHDSFKDYGRQVKTNASVLASTLLNNEIDIVTDGTDTHLVLLDLSRFSLTGQQVQDALAEINITSNKNPIPFDARQPSKWVGLRLGVSAATTRGLKDPEMVELGEIIAQTIKSYGRNNQTNDCKTRVAKLCQAFPIY